MELSLTRNLSATVLVILSISESKNYSLTEQSGLVMTSYDSHFFSSSKEPEGVKAYFILRFRAADTFLGKLLDKLGEGKIAAAGN